MHGKTIVHCCVILSAVNILVLFCSAYRIASGRHTLAQTLVGAVVGIIAGVSASIVETNWLTVYVPTDVLEHAPMQLRYAMIGACLVGLYTRDFIFHVVLGR